MKSVAMLSLYAWRRHLTSTTTLLQFRTSRVEAISNKKMAVDSNLSLEQELL